jgi:hypothetical protein
MIMNKPTLWVSYYFHIFNYIQIILTKAATWTNRASVFKQVIIAIQT